MQISILGFGALGTLLAFRLHKTNVCNVWCFGKDNAHCRKVRADGVVVDGEKRFLGVRYDSLRNLPATDLAILTVPLHQLNHDFLLALREYCGTIPVLPLTNGVAVNSILNTYSIPRHFYGVASVSCSITEPGVIAQHSKKCKLVIGDACGQGLGSMQPFAKLFRQAGIDVTITKDGRKATWLKAAFLVPLASACCAYKCKAGALKRDKQKWAKVVGSAEEIINLAEQQGIPPPRHALFQLERVNRGLLPSPAFDVLRGIAAKNTELPDLVGPFLALGKCPNLEYLYDLAKRGSDETRNGEENLGLL